MCYNRSMNNANASVQIQAIRALSNEIPLNDFGLPTGIYRTDLLPYHDYKPNGKTNGSVKPDDSGAIAIEHDDVLNGKDLTTDPDTSVPDVYRIGGFPATALSNAFMPLQFDEGFPAFDNGQAFWSRLEYEPADAFEAFQKYLHMSLGKAGTIPEYDAEDDGYDGREATGIRNISALADEYPDGQLLKMVDLFKGYFHLYYWGMRAHAYDMFRVAQHRTQQELRQVESQDEHYVQARRLRHRLMQYMNDEEDFWDMMTPKTGIDMFKTITQLERISAGLPAGGPSIGKNGVAEEQGKPFEVILRTVAQGNRRITNATATDEAHILDKALEDPESTKVLQELIISIGGH